MLRGPDHMAMRCTPRSWPVESSGTTADYSKPMSMRTLITNARVLDVEAGDYRAGLNVLVEDGHILDVGDSVTASGADTIDAADRVVMPGLIDAHVHPMISSLNIGSLADVPLTLLAQRARAELERTLARGFTTVRDACGSDRGL